MNESLIGYMQAEFTTHGARMKSSRIQRGFGQGKVFYANSHVRQCGWLGDRRRKLERLYLVSGIVSVKDRSWSREREHFHIWCRDGNLHSIIEKMIFERKKSVGRIKYLPISNPLKSIFYSHSRLSRSVKIWISINI